VLLDRDKRSVELTRVGRDLLPAFERTLQDFDAALESARDLANEKRGIVRLAALPSVAAGLLPDAIRSFRERRPNVSFDLRDVIAGEVLSLVQTEQVDFGVMGGSVNAVDVEKVFEAKDRLDVVYPKGHPIGRPKRVTPVLLAEFPLILLHRDTSVRAIVDAGFQAAGLAPRAAGKAIYMMTAVGMVRAGLGLTILPGSA
jgi:DNA-binding transcriptional LysR family regulator